MNKVLVQIDTFIQSKDSEEITIECINRIKNIGFPILLTSHLPIPEYISSMCDYCEVDLNNPLLEPDGTKSVLSFNCDSFSTAIRLNNPDPHAPACLTSLINGSIFSKNNGFDFFIRFEYDSIIKLDSIQRLKNLIEAGSMCKGLVFSNKNWIDGKVIMCSSEDYLNYFDKQIITGDDYMRFVSDEEITINDRRHLQSVQYQVLNNKGLLDSMIQVPVNMLGTFLDSDFITNKTKEIGIFRPAYVFDNPNKFAVICHGWDRELDFEFQILIGDKIQNESHSFVKNFVTYKTFELKPETLYKVIYVNPVKNTIEEWEFSSSEQLKDIATIKLN